MSAAVDRPILLSGAMVRAVLDGRKSQTRLLMKPQPIDLRGPPHPGEADAPIMVREGDCQEWKPKWCPFQVGQRLWVRETFRAWAVVDGCRIGYEADGGHRYVTAASIPGFDRATNLLPGRVYGGWLRPSVHMPRWASRITLDVVDVRVERLQDISEEDARAEGIVEVARLEVGEVIPLWGVDEVVLGESPRDAFAALWDGINGSQTRHFDNPWVWVVSFRRVNAPVDEETQP